MPPPPVAGHVPTDWAALAPVPYIKPPEMTPGLSGFVAGEIAAGRCPVSRPADGHYVVKLDIATLVDADGTVRRTVPRAIQCPTVEQYGAGLVISFARANLRAGAAGDRWYRATIVFDWQG
ncbi:hypothetical protein H5J25_07645 [Sphingomonas aliaeris]|uniref:Uncharacterized protein n=1 Tax=Sphingomonas aliaeris TaxID=2759526 RepID=A0A974NX51_9SPHN|nr:hypothetical protein [Sphingomonas aliaeris]QQV78498.1 hypothetical protein H5J25_07645 [Sphingomonas aliaeris]